MLLKFIIRNIRKRLFLNLIKVVGLTLGLSGILFISLFLKREFSFDQFNSKADRIYRFTTTDPRFMNNTHWARLYYNSDEIPRIADYFPEIESYVRLFPIRGGAVVQNEMYYNINQAFICDSTFFTIFDTKLLAGDTKTVLNYPASMVITQSFAKSVFGAENPIGQIISIPAGQFYGHKIDFTVSGIMVDFPQNSHFHPDLIASSPYGEMSGWAYAYLLLKSNTNPQNVIDNYNAFRKNAYDLPEDYPEAKLHLQKITDIHLHSDKLREIESNGNMAYVYVLLVAAIVLLLISLSNFASLNLGMSIFNFKFIAINRILGSNRNNNTKYYLVESVFIVLISIILTATIIIPLNALIHKLFNINLIEGNLIFSLLLIAIYGLLGILVGMQPVFSQKIQQITHKSEVLIPKNILISKGIIITQYTLAIVLIVAVFVIKRQTNFALNRSMGDDQSNILVLESVHANVQTKFQIFKEELLKHQSIQSVSAMMEPPGGEANDHFQYQLEDYPTAQEGEQPNMIGVFPCDYSFANVFDLTFLSGENFTTSNSDVDGSGEYILNEAAMKQLQIPSPEAAIGKEFQLIFHNNTISLPKGRIVGVVRDFHLSSIKKQVKPLVFFKRDHMWLLNFAIAYQPNMKADAVADIQQVWNKLFPAYPFQYEQIGSMYKKVYKTELLQAQLLSVFTLIALFISSIGLLGISLLVSQQRVKEIGVRKVNGASISEILTLLNKRFVWWMCIAFMIAIPLAYLGMHLWLESFAYKTTLSWWIFALAGILALIIALLTVSWQSWKAATKNPVESLRYE